jgi:hypothetical protein
MKLTVTLDRDEDGVWVVECPSIPGCVSQGKTKEEALNIMVKEGEIITLSIPDHKEIAKSTLRSLIRSARITVDEFTGRI